jgi:uncharacterized protein (TIGR03437 family)
MGMNRNGGRFGSLLRNALVLSVLVLAPAPQDAQAQVSGGVRRPRGIYTVIDIDGYIDTHAGMTLAEHHEGLISLYATALDNPAVSGLAIQMGWHRLNPNPPTSAQPYDWSYLDEVFSSASAWNAAHPSQAPKTIQMILFPGFFTPQWVFDQITSCDGLFQTPPQTPPSCGKVTVTGYGEPHEGTVLPLPWDPIYKSSYRAFVAAFAARFGGNPILASVAVSGPTAASNEILLPDTGNTPPQAQFGGITPEQMWLKLLAFAFPGQPAYQKSDQAFVDEWIAAIDMYADIFSDVTLTVASAGLPDLGTGLGLTVPNEFTQWCTPPTMGCAAITTIFAHVVDPKVGGSNAKAVEGDGLNGRTRPVSNVLRFMTQSTEPLPSTLARVLEGEQMGTGFSTGGIQFGCTKPFPPSAADKPAGCTIPSTCTTSACIPVACIPQACLAPGVTQGDLASFTIFGNVPAKDLIPPEQALYNILRDTFDDTTNASFFGSTAGTVPENYLQIYFSDFQYAAAHAALPAQVVKTDGTIVAMTAQDQLNLASQRLREISQPAPAITTVANAEGENPIIAPNTWVEIKGSNLAPAEFDRTWGSPDFVNKEMPTALSGVSSTVNGKSAFVYYMSPTQVNILTPPDAMSGLVQVQVTTNGQTTASFTAQAQALSPSFFVFTGGRYVAATHADGSYLGPASLYPGSTTPAKPGETVVLYANGFGPPSNPVVSGSVVQSGSLSPLPVVNIGGVAAKVTFAGLVLPGEFQFNVVVPPNTPAGDQLITATYNGLVTQSGTLITIQE